MREIVDFLEKSGVHYFATVGLDGKPKVRPFQFMMEREGKLYFCTSNRKTVYGEMERTPWVEVCATNENFSWLRLSGRAVFSDDTSVKAAIQEKNALVKSIYRTPDNPEFEIFYLEDATATISDFSAPPRSFAL